MNHTALTIRLSCLALLALAACRQTAAPPGTQPPEEKTNVVQVQATEYSFSMPDRVTGGVITFEMANIGGLPHEFAFGRLEEGTEPEDVLQAIEKGREPEGVDDLAGVPALSPQGNMSMARDLEPGTYGFVCFFPSPEGKPHVALGMIKFFEVSGESEAALPEPDATIVATDEGFEVPEISAGRQTLELRNDGKKPHEFALFSLQPGKKERDIDRWFGSGLKGDPPAVFPGGMQSIDPGTSVFVTVELEAGRTYQLQDFEAGLQAEITP
jgi:hypothetical protein